MTGVVRYAEPEPRGLAALLGGLIEQNLARDPARARLLRPGRVSVSASDAGVAVTLTIRPGLVDVRDGVDPNARLRVVADSRRLLALTSVPLRLGLPDPFTPEGRAVVGDLLHRRVRIRGSIAHPLLLARLTMLLSVR